MSGDTSIIIMIVTEVHIYNCGMVAFERRLSKEAARFVIPGVVNGYPQTRHMVAESRIAVLIEIAIRRRAGRRGQGLSSGREGS
jgi:hypothetical protein